MHLSAWMKHCTKQKHPAETALVSIPDKNQKINQCIEYSEEVPEALQHHKPVAATENGGTFAGIPYPENVATAKKVSRTVRTAGAVPAYV